MECLLHPGGCGFSFSLAHSFSPCPSCFRDRLSVAQAIPELCVPGSLSSCPCCRSRCAPHACHPEAGRGPAFPAGLWSPSGGTELCVWNRRTRNGEEMSFLTSWPNRNFHCDSELPGQNRKTDLGGSRELLTTWCQSVGI